MLLDNILCVGEEGQAAGLPPPGCKPEVESYERARQREIAAYLAAASFPPDIPSGPLPETILNPDPTLNALVQLGAHRLGCDRAFLSLIDRNYQFVVAEITRTHSLTEKRCAPNEHMFLGVAKLDACWGVCPMTMNAFLDETGEWVKTGPNVISNRTRYIINDFTTEPGYTDRSYVVNYPYFRSYLEVPLVSPLGYLLGSYCVVDNKPNEYDNDETVGIMNEISDAIMAHLELRRLQQSRDRSEELVKGLSQFINYEPSAPHPSSTLPHVDTRENTSSAKNGGAQSIDRSVTSTASPADESQFVQSALGSLNGSGLDPPKAPTRLAGSSSGSTQRSASQTASWVGDSAEAMRWKEVSDAVAPQPGELRPTLGHASSSIPSYESISSSVERSSSETPPTTPSEEVLVNPFDQQDARESLNGADGPADAAAGQQDGPTMSDDDTRMTELQPNGFISSANIKSTLFRAAVTIRQTMNIDGFMFLDAVPSAYTDRPDQLAPDEEVDVARESTVGPFCPAIVKSTADPGGGQTGGAVSQSSQTRLPESVLQRLIRKFPQGHVFSADEFGPIDETFAPGKPWPGCHPEDNFSMGFKNDIAALFRGVPSAKYIIFLPLWHFQQECWFTAAVGWVSDPMKAMDLADLSLIAAFGNSVMAEVSRLEALAVSRAKSDFVSSISHELRSPLHGIMAGSELLREEISNPSSIATLDMLESCGTTLLDIFNNLLQHAIVTSSGGRYTTTMADIKTTDLCGLVEDVIDVIHMSHLSEFAFHISEYRKGSYALGPHDVGKQQRHRPLLISLNMEKRSTWKVPVNIGAWKRIVMNIVGNALKYTAAGRIQVSLREVQRQDKSGKMCSYISFSVEDTGRGMSSDYLKYKLFMPFSQEDMNSKGLGLGLSIVQHLARGLGGTVGVKSSVGVGTSVEVLVPLDQDFPASPGLHAVVEHEKQSFEGDRQRLAGRTVCLVTPEAYVSVACPGLKVPQSIARRSVYVEQAFRTNAATTLGMSLVLGTAENPLPAADLYILDCDILNKFEGDIQGSVIPDKLSAAGPLVLLCAAGGPPSCLKQEALKNHLHHLHHPLGPRKLVSALCGALDAGKAQQQKIAPEYSMLKHDKAVPVVSAASIPAIPQFALRPKMAEEKNDMETSTVEMLPSPSPPRPPVPPPVITIQEATEPLPIPSPSIVHLPKPVPGKGTEPQSQTKTYNLLLVDDNPINIKLLAAVTGKLKHSFSTACNGLEAVQLYKDALQQPRQLEEPSQKQTSSPSEPVLETETQLLEPPSSSSPPPEQQPRPQSTPESRSAAQAAEATKADPGHPFDLIFMDLSMPVMDGFEATREIRRIEKQAGVPHKCKIVALTGLSSESSRIDALSAGSDLFITKPVKLGTVKKLLGELLEQKERDQVAA
ncbi:hypothetical protein F5Y17DRAFT_423009 [Xylariaceae sp. FL0594]|nr:hypothetical protein F5Y17DRAFT_423009 [Xylariaceae sp. FL0594]